jgi:hypothetical protein
MLTLIIAALAAAGAAQFEARTLDGQTAAGALVSVDAQQLVLETADGPKTLPIASLAVVSRQPAPAARTEKLIQVELIDGSRLAVAEYAAGGQEATLEIAGGEKLAVALSSIRWVRFAAPADAEQPLAKQWSEITQLKAAGDLLVVRKKGALDYLEGVLSKVDVESCQFEIDNEQIAVPRAKLAGLVYARPPAGDLPEALAELVTADGARLPLRSLTLADGKLRVATPGGIELALPVDHVARIDFSSGKIVYLSDLEPEAAEYTPLLGLKPPLAGVAAYYAYRRDVGFDRNPLVLDGKRFAKGLSLASRTTLAYRLPGKFRQFRAVVGIDDAVRETGNVHVEITGDGKPLWQGDVRGSDAARELELEIDGVRRLAIVCDYGADLDIGDRLNLAEARVTK